MGDRNKAISAEVAKLVDPDILQEAIFPTWIENLVMVKKHDGSWWMCIQVFPKCPKDHYPFLEIDQKLESLEGFQSKCFLSAYKGYHQVQMRI